MQDKGGFKCDAMSKQSFGRIFKVLVVFSKIKLKNMDEPKVFLNFTKLPRKLNKKYYFSIFSTLGSLELYPHFQHINTLPALSIT